MNMWVVGLGVFIVFVALWAVVIRPYLRKVPAAQGFLAKLEPVEKALWLKCESILWARALQVVGGVLALLTWVGQLNLTPFIMFLPEKYQTMGFSLLPMLPLLINVVGTIQEFLRRDTSEPLEMVEAASPDAPIPVQEAIQNFKNARAEVKAVIAEAKADGSV